MLTLNNQSNVPAFDAALATKVKQSGIIAVLVIDDPQSAIPLAETLLKNGIGAMELTLRTPSALEALRTIRENVPDMTAGAGTVLTVGQVDEVFESGAEFAVAPGFNRKVVERARELGLSFAPGVMTPSDIEGALEMNCRILKFFPAETTGGLKHLKAMAAPYIHLGVSFIPLGGINAANLSTYMASSLVGAIGGSWIATREMIASKDWAAIGKNAAEAVAIIKAARGEK